MKNWSLIKLGDVMETQKGAAFKSSKYTDAGVPIVRVSDFTDSSISRSQIMYYSEEDATKFFSYKLSEWDILIQTVGSWQHNPQSIVGKVVKVPKDLGGSLLNQNIVKIIPRQEIDKRFLYYRLRDESFKFYNLGCAQGAANQASITLDSIRKFEFHLPPISIQTKIASILSPYDDLIENNLKRIKLLEELAQRTYEEWFVKFKVNGEQLEINGETGLPEGWEKKRLDEVASINSKSVKKDFEGLLKYVDISSVSTGRIDSWIEYDFTNAPGRARRIVNHGDIIWSCVRPNRKSYSMIWNPEINLIVSTGFAVITPISLPSSYLYQFLTTDTFVSYLTNLATGATYPAVTSQAFEDAEITIPNRVLVESFDLKFRPSIDLIWNLTKQNQFLKEARDILLPRLMVGAIDIDRAQEESLAIAAEPKLHYSLKK
ncbi:MAG: restriction endonuclease subunit S [Cyclobacteriaceae bacterium]|jgi:type I restriction enzyme S subunit|nr:restriction endonuclease subunit S [Cyclobacteriaceae bacterium]